MFKETVICIIIVVAIVSLDIFTQGYTQRTTSEITQIFTDLKGEILKEDKTQIENKVKSLDEKWEQKHDALAYYIEHDELEKVESNFNACKSLAKTREYEQSISELEKTVYVLEHITDKYSFNLVNIF